MPLFTKESTDRARLDALRQYGRAIEELERELQTYARRGWDAPADRVRQNIRALDRMAREELSVPA